MHRIKYILNVQDMHNIDFSVVFSFFMYHLHLCSYAVKYIIYIQYVHDPHWLHKHAWACTIHVNSLHHFDYKYAHIYHQHHPPRYSTTAPHATEHVSSFFTKTSSSKCSLLDLSATITICFTCINQTLFKILQQFLRTVCHILAQGCRNREARLDYPVNLLL